MRQWQLEPFNAPDTSSLSACSRLETHAANDNVSGIIMPDDGPFPLDLALIFAAIVVLAAYVLMSGSDDVMATLWR